MLIIIAVIVIIAYAVFGNIRHVPFLSRQPNVTINNHTFTVEVAKSSAEKEKGLSGRSSLPSNHGMYFPFDSADYYSFWMKDMQFPIDIIYISHGKVVTIFANVKPAVNPSTTVVKPKQPADAVLELHAGSAKTYSIKEGDSIAISL